MKPESAMITVPQSLVLIAICVCVYRKQSVHSIEDNKEYQVSVHLPIKTILLLNHLLQN